MIPAIAIPALVALVFKLGLLGYSIKLQATSFLARLAGALLLVFALHNSAEFIALSYYNGEVTPLIERVGYAYIGFLTLAAALVLHASLQLSFESPSDDKRIGLQWLIYLPAGVLLYLLLATDQLVIGFQTFRNTLLRIPGPLYLLFEIYLPIYLLVALVYLTHGALGSRQSAYRRNRCRLWLLVLLPIGVAVWYLIIANHYGLAKFTSTIYLPIPWTVFLLVAIYTTHHYRLFDIAFFVPGSKVRKRKTAFYRRVQALTETVTDLRSVQKVLDDLADTFHCSVALIGGPRPLTAREERAHIDNADLLTQFPGGDLKKIDSLIVAEEIAESEFNLYVLMRRHQVGAIVPINVRNSWSAHWILLGEGFSEQVYTPLDFKVVESLFDRVAECFLDNALPLRSQLVSANHDLRECKHRLAVIWDELDTLRKNVASGEVTSRQLYEEEAILLRQQFTGIEECLPEPLASGDKTLEQYLAAAKAEIVTAALQRCYGDETQAARLLGISSETFRRILERRERDLNP